MAVLTIKNGQTTVEGEGRVEFDPSIAAELLVRGIQQCQANQIGLTLPDLYPALSPSAKDLLRETCQAHDDLQVWFEDIQRNFASVGQPRGRWRVNAVWRCLIRTWLFDEILIDAENRRFVRLAHGEIVTEAELVHRHNRTITQHLDEFLEATTFTIEQVKRVLTSVIAEKTLLAANPSGGLERITIRGPACLDVSQWTLPAGYQLMEYN
jgi:hypothetical protein